jgi:hypothetical protein
MPPLAGAARAAGVNPPTADKWLGRYLAEGEAGLIDRSSRPKRKPPQHGSAQGAAVVKLRRRRLMQGHIAAQLGVSPSTDSGVMGKRIPGGSRSPMCAGWEYLFVAIALKAINHRKQVFGLRVPDKTGLVDMEVLL